MTASRDVSVEDSLYETVKELKDHPGSLAVGLPNGHGTTSPFSPDDDPHHLPPSHHRPALHNGHLSPCSTPERGPLCAGVEYASVDLNKKSRFSADLETRRSATITAAVNPTEDPEEEDRPPPIPDKVLDENDNQPTMMDAGAVHNGEVRIVFMYVREGEIQYLYSRKTAQLIPD